MPTANNIIQRAMVKAGVIYPGESVPANKINQMYEELNSLIEAWALEKLMVVADVLENFSLTAGKSEYTYGLEGDFDSPRPIEIKDDCFVRLGSTDSPVRLKDLSTYRSISTKSTSGIPWILSYNPEYPLMKVFLWPTPSESFTLFIRASKTLTSFSDKTTNVNLEPGYTRALVANLALEICPNFGKKASGELIMQARESKKAIKSANSIPIRESKCPDFASLMNRRGGNKILGGPFS